MNLVTQTSSDQTAFRRRAVLSRGQDPVLVPSPHVVFVPGIRQQLPFSRTIIPDAVIESTVSVIIQLQDTDDHVGITRIIGRATLEYDSKPGWYSSLEQVIENQLTYDDEEGYPTADVAAKEIAVLITRKLVDAVGSDAPEPYFDVAPDCGVDIYFDFGPNELMIHVPPPDSENRYCFVRLGGERSVYRHPSITTQVQFLKQVIAEDVIPAE